MCWEHRPGRGPRCPSWQYRRQNCVEAAKKVVDLALDVSGGSGMFKRSELERLYRDVRAGGFHPANSFLVHELVGKTALGARGQYPRWG
jgi:alkylation response protein AidB-like acyl-CoA dehydrogenase